MLSTLVGSTFGLLRTQPQLAQQAANVSRMIADPKLPSDHLSHSLTRPYISSKPVRLSSLRQKLTQPRSLIFTQTWRCARRRLVSQAFHALFSGTLHPLAYGSFGDPPEHRPFCVCFQPRSFSSKARKRLPSRQSLAWLDNVFSIVEYSLPLSLQLYAEISKKPEIHELGPPRSSTGYSAYLSSALRARSRPECARDGSANFAP